MDTDNRLASALPKFKGGEKSMKKRFLAILLTVVLALALAVPGFAATETRITFATYVNPWAFDNSQHLVKVNHNGMFGYVNYYGTIRVHEKYSSLNSFSENLAVAYKDGVASYVDAAGNEVITLGVCEAHDFHQGRARIVDNKDGHNNTYFIDKTGKSVILLGNTTADDFQSVGLAKIYRNGLIGQIDVNGNNVNHIQFSTLRNYVEGLAYCEWTDANGFHKGYLNTKGQLQIAGLNTSYVYSDFSDGMAKVYDPATSQVGYIDTTGWLAVYCQYEDGDDFHNGVARIKRGGLWGYIDKTNKYTVQPEYDYLGSNITEGDVVVAGKNYDAVRVSDGSVIRIDPSNNHLYLADSNTYTWVRNPAGATTWYGYVNVLNGVEVVKIDPNNNNGYLSAAPFSNGLARVGLWNNTVSFVNLAGVRVIDLGATYDRVGNFSNELCWVIKNGKYGYINKTGALQLPMIFDVLAGTDPANFVNGAAPARLASFSASSRWGVVSSNCTWIVNPQYTSIDQRNNADMVYLAQYGGVCSHILVLNG